MARCRTLGCTGFLWLGFIACTGGGSQQGFGVSNPGGGGGGGGSTDSRTETGDNQETDGLSLGSPIDCPNPKSEVAYEEMGETLGLSGDINPDRPRIEGGSASWADIDEDGDLDILIGYPRQPVRLYRAGPEGFEETQITDTDEHQLLNLLDIDGDGDRDLLTGVGQFGAQVLRNDNGDFVLTEIEGISPNSEVAVKEFSSADLNQDGRADLYAVVNDWEMHSDYLVVGKQDGTFRGAAGKLQANVGTRMGFDSIWFDWQNDGDMDLYVVNDRGAEFGSSMLLANEGGSLVDASSDCMCGLTHNGMGVDIGDFNRDGLVDLYISATDTSVLLQGAVDGTFIDVTASLGANSVEQGYDQSLAMSWGAVFLDYDNDGRTDMLVAQGDLQVAAESTDEPGANEELPDPIDFPIDMLRQKADGSFRELGSSLGLSRAGSFRATIAADANGDGVLDLLVTETAGTPKLYLSTGCTANNWLEVAAPAGTRVEVTADGVTQTDWVTAESGYAGSGPLRVHFGLGNATEVEQLTLKLPTGETLEASGFEARRVVSVLP
ncbi:MAG: CRTAC1 family protein [Myxococcota bacterium]|nr:CRTAC1 family protein [Myxococcota bacterium]